MKVNGALTIAEGSPKYKTDVSLVIGGSVERKYVIRTAFDCLSIWKTKYAKNISPFYPRLRTSIKDAAVIDNEVWIFGVDARNYQQIVDSIKIGARYYQVPASEIMRDVYVKNLNAERENEMELEALIRANMRLYQATTVAIKRAAEVLGIRKEINFYIFSAGKNQKIPKENLRSSLENSGAKKFQSDTRIHITEIGSNDGARTRLAPNNLFLATL